tara:strand:+ start:481 stop:1026 length:546 start_codon:yes stop_codon:yes gene_type:complete
MKIFILFFIFLSLTTCSSDESKKIENHIKDTNLVCRSRTNEEDKFIFKINVERENFALFYPRSDGTGSWFRWGTDDNQFALPFCCATVTISYIELRDDKLVSRHLSDDIYADYFIFNRETLSLSTQNLKKNRKGIPNNFYQCRIVSETESKALRELKIKEKIEQYNKEKALEEEQKKKNKI